MSTTQIYQGLNDGRNSSKVMAPPGGASSNIFGVEPSYRTQGGDCAPKEPTPKAADTKNRLFGDEGASPAAAAAAESSPQPQAPPAGVNTHAGKRNHVTYDKPAESDEGVITACRKRFFRNEGRGEEEEEEDEEEKKKREEEERRKALEAEKALIRQKARGAYNPITGEAYPDKAQEEPAARVRQPPGGRSSGPLW